MCFHISISKSKNQVSDRFKIAFEDLDYEPVFHLNGFSNQKCYVISITNKNKLTSAVWGLKPADFSATDNFNLNTLNAKSETVFDSPFIVFGGWCGEPHIFASFFISLFKI